MNQLFLDLTLADLVDIVVVAGLVYGVLVALRQTRTTFVFAAILSLTTLYIAALTVGLRLTSFLFNILFTVSLVALVVIFQEEVRISFERWAAWAFGRRRDDVDKNSADDIYPTLVKTLLELSHERIGALVVLEGNDELSRHLDGGSPLDGQISAPLLKSIFDPHSVGHDGAVVVQHDRITRFGCRLPLSDNAEQLGYRGTRHAAALGLSERTDSLCIVVSEERGTVSIAHEGRLDVIGDPGQLEDAIRQFCQPSSPNATRPLWMTLLTQHLRAKAASLALAVALWFVVVHESVVEYRGFSVPIEHAGLSPSMTVSSIEPKSARVIVSGPRRSFYFIHPQDFRVVVKLFDAQPGAAELTVTASDLTLPNNLAFVNVVPRNVKVTISDQGVAPNP